MSTRQPEGLDDRLTLAIARVERSIGHRNNVYTSAACRIIQELSAFLASDTWDEARALLRLTQRRIVLGFQFMPHRPHEGAGETEQSTRIVALVLSEEGFCSVTSFGTPHDERGEAELISLNEFATCLLACTPLLDIENPLAELYKQLDRLARIVLAE